MNIDYKSIFRFRGRIVILSSEKCDLSSIFGVVSFSSSIRIKQDIEKIKKTAAEIYNGGVFRVSARRITKEFPLTSRRVNEIVGEHLVKKGGSVDLENFEEEIGIEFLDGHAYLFKERIDGPGGLPVGVQGRVLCIMEDKQDLAAALLMLKRGCEIDYCGKNPKELYKYSSGHEIHPYDEKEPYPFAVSGKTLENFEELLEEKKRIEKKYGLKTLFPLIGTAVNL
ncbi:MAG: THUMP domain-containing protein [Euryarchaeota archaeon]|nr:THUMP domain-containing protein [Euryarchaeota archaeon]